MAAGNSQRNKGNIKKYKKEGVLMSTGCPTQGIKWRYISHCSDNKPKKNIRFTDMNNIDFPGLIGCLIFVLSFSITAGAAPESCTWVNDYERDENDNGKVETITPRIKPGRNEDGQPRYESCAEATARRKQQVERRLARRNAGRDITGGTQRDCYWTAPVPPKTEYKLQVKQLGTDSEGNPRYESCASAQRRKQKEWIDTEFNGHIEDAQAEIDKYNEEQQEKADSANERADKAAEKQQLASYIAIAGAIAAGVKAASCCSQTPMCPQCGLYVALSAGLGVTGMLFGNAAGDNKKVAAEYRGLLGDPDNPGGSDGGITGPGGPGSGGTGGTLPENGPIVPDYPNKPPPVITTGGGGTTTPTPENFKKILEDNGLKWNPEEGKITLPNGDSYTADDINKPEISQHASSAPAAALKRQIAGLEKQIKDSMGIDNIAGVDEGTDEDVSLGGGGFAGYSAGARGSRGGRNSLLAGLGRKPGSSTGSGTSASKVAGMSVKMGKNRVGVSQDNIFEMIHRRYQTKRRKQQFIELNL